MNILLLISILSFINPCLPEIDTLPCGFETAAEIASEGHKVKCTYINDTRRARVVYRENRFVSVAFYPLGNRIYIYDIRKDMYFLTDRMNGICDRPISKKEACRVVREIIE